MEGVVWEILLLGLLPQWKEGEEGENRNRLLKVLAEKEAGYSNKNILECWYSLTFVINFAV